MSETKACNLTEEEIKQLINYHGYSTEIDFDTRLDRMNYLNKRLKAFKEPEEKPKAETPETPTPTGWPTNG